MNHSSEHYKQKLEMEQENKTYRCGFVGSQGVGKSSIVKALAELPQFKDFHIATERSKYLRDLGVPLNNMSTIYGQHLFACERLGELQHNKMLTDRTIIDVMSFTSLSPVIEDQDKSMFEVYFSRFIKQYDYLFYIPIEFDIEENSVRCTDNDFRIAIDEKIKHYIDWYGFRIKNLHTISGTMDERIKQVLDIIEF